MKFVYQSQKTKLRSTPVDEADATRRTVLERSGWRIVERIPDLDEKPAIAEPRVAIKHAAVVGGEAVPSKDPQTIPADFPFSATLIASGIDTLDKLREAVPTLMKTKGFGPKRAAAIREGLEVLDADKMSGAEE